LGKHLNKCDFIIYFILYYLKLVISDRDVTFSHFPDFQLEFVKVIL